MRLALRALAALFVLLAVWFAVEMIAAESGEVVVLTTTDAEGASQQTRLWVVDHEGRAWLRSGSNLASWYGNLRREPLVEVERGGTSARYTAVPVPDARDVINRRMAEKYGWAEAYIGFFFSRERAVPIRLDPPAASRGPADAHRGPR